ncbi:NAD(+)/NADH kinase [Nonomuraea sp. KC401]|uniref:NAD(+)/NADH kinase n=1 Tax=unclassified Nonomuraea TaxID=2593643 RepID=UPI0010FE856A|nr:MULTISPECIES: NAD(+)/NADH kinase [unclassified Nonomuraea]NBE95614.1 NAD(+)/NADH kinase [Nonomuraea sp. K271]TLF71539.1 NAD(+)/NADH kinase [Nonomuraea sp. KC401]
MGMVGTVGLVLHPQRDSRKAIDTILRWAAGNDVTVLGLPEEVGRIDCSAVPVDTETLVERSDLLVGLGGDGTMLRTMRLLAGRRTPILGVNLGRLGFLAEIDVDDLAGTLSAIDEHRYTIEPRMAIQAEVQGADVTAFNDIALVRIPGEGLAGVAVSAAGSDFVRFAADAVIVSTSTGSTAYSFSAGGPIVSPRVEAVLVVPAAAHSAFNRALVLPADEKVTLQVLPTSGRLAVEVDGAVLGHLCPGDSITVAAWPGAAQVVRLGTTFYDRARRKLRVDGSAEAY